jgi:putative PEP-CTERM system TPR-repeat lipoprotein
VREVTAGGAPAAGLTPEQRAELQAIRGHGYVALGKRDAAEALYKESLGLVPDNAEATLGMAQLAAVRGELAPARAQLEALVARDPQAAAAWSFLGDLYRAEGEAERAEKAYGQAIDLRGPRLDDLLGRVLARAALGRFEAASADVRQLRKRWPRLPSGHYAAGVVHFAQRQYEPATAAFQEALAAAPGYLPAVFYLGLAHGALGRLEQAEEHLARYSAAVPGSSLAAKALATVRLQRGDYTGARRVLEPFTRPGHEDVEALELLALAALVANRPAERTEHLKRLVAYRPESVDAYLRLGSSLLDQGDAGAAEQALEKALELAPDPQRPEFLRVAALINAGQLDAALASVDALVAKYPEAAWPLTVRGFVQVRRGDLGSAKASFREALRLAPGEPSAAQNLAAILLREGRVAEARAVHEEVLAKRPGFLGSAAVLAQIDLAEGKRDAARARLEQALAANADAWQATVFLARLDLEDGQPERALDRLQEVAARHPELPAVLAELGRAQLALDQGEPAVATLERLAQVRPEAAESHYLLAQAYGKVGQADRVGRALETAVTREPRYLPAQLALAGFYVQQGHGAEAERAVERMRRTWPEHPDVLARAAEVEVLQGRPQAAVPLYAAALKAAPSGGWTIALAQAHWQAGQRAEALGTLERWAAEHQKDVPVLLALSEAYLGLDRADDGVGALRRLVEVAPDNALALNNLAWQLRQRSPAEALGYAQRARERAPRSPDVLETLGVVLTEAGRPAEAVAVLQEAAALAPGGPSIQYYLAVAQSRQGDAAAARRTLERLLASAPEFAEAADARALLARLAQ